MVPEGWSSSKLGEHVAIKHGFAFSSEYFTDEGDDILLTPGNFFEEGGFRFLGQKQKRYQGPVPEDFVLKPGNMLVVMTEQAPGLLGSTMFVPSDARYLHNQRLGLIQLKNDDQIDLRYLHSLMSTPRIRRRISAEAGGTKVKHTSPGKITSLDVELPPLPEQRKIAEILSTWDEAIETTEVLLATARTQKRALMQSLLTGKRRFPEFEGQEWKEVRLGDVADIRIGGTPARKEPSYWRSGSNIWLSIADLGPKYVGYSKEMITDEGVARSNVKLLPENTVVMSFKLTIGKLGITKVPLYTNEAICGFVPKSADGFSPEFLFQLLHVSDLLADVDQAVKGKTLNKAKLNELRLVLPAIDEQNRIAEFLLIADEEIDNAEAQIEKLRTEKKALMQQLLTGKRRVAV